MDKSEPQPAPDETKAEWQFKPEAPAATAPAAPQKDTASVSWTASEYIAHHKSFSWYALLTFGAVVSAVLAYLLTKDWISSGVIIFVAIIFGVTGGRKPRVLAYSLDASGLAIAEKFYPYADFKSYAVAPEAAFTNITFLPLKRFMPALTMYVAPEDEAKIVQILSKHLPFEQHPPGAIESLMQRIRF